MTNNISKVCATEAHIETQLKHLENKELSMKTTMVEESKQYTELECTAVHQAGHVVFSRIMTFRSNGVSIIPNRNSRGRVNPHLRLCQAFMDPVMYVGYRLAGPVAQSKIDNTQTLADLLIAGEGMDDYLVARGVLDWLFNISGCKADSNTDSMINLLIPRLCEYFNQSETWGLVTGLATRLLSEGKLTGNQVGDFFLESEKGYLRQCFLVCNPEERRVFEPLRWPSTAELEWITRSPRTFYTNIQDKINYNKILGLFPRKEIEVIPEAPLSLEDSINRSIETEKRLATFGA